MTHYRAQEFTIVESKSTHTRLAVHISSMSTNCFPPVAGNVVTIPDPLIEGTQRAGFLPENDCTNQLVHVLSRSQ